MDCVFHALSSPPPETRSLLDEAMRLSNATYGTAKRPSIQEERTVQVMGNARGKPRILLPDLLIALAVCRLAEWDLGYRGCLEERRLERERRRKLMQESLIQLESTMNVMEGGEEQEEEDGNGKDREKEEGDGCDRDVTSPTEQEPTPPPRSDGLLLASLLAFRIYDGYQRQNTVTRDTLQRFLSDVHGEESYKAPAVKQCLDELFTAADAAEKSVPRLAADAPGAGAIGSGVLGAIDAEKFMRGIHATMAFLPSSVSNTALCEKNRPSSLTASHILLDWILIVFNCMLPRVLPPPPKVAAHHLRIVNSDPIRMIDALSAKYGLCDDGDGGESDNILYEMRRRFHSLQQHNLTGSSDATKDKEGGGSGGVDSNDEAPTSRLPLEESPPSSVGAANMCPNTGALLPPSAEEGEDAESSTPRPRNVVDEHSFVVAVSRPNDELGHGGYLPAELARWTFRACAGRAEEIKAAGGGDLWQSTRPAGVNATSWEKKEQSSRTKGGNGDCFWTMYDALSFGCDAVRWDAVNTTCSDDDALIDLQIVKIEKFKADMPLLRLAFKAFLQLPRQEKHALDSVLTKSQVGKMLLLLLEHESFRLEADSPPEVSSRESRNSWSTLRGDSKGDDPLDNDDFLRNLSKTTDGLENVLSTFVDASYASLLGLMPPKIDSTKFDTTSRTEESQKDDPSPAHLVPLSVLVDYAMSESCGKSADDCPPTLDFKGFVKWHLHLASNDTNEAIPISQTRLGPYMMELRLIASVLFGLRPASPAMERCLIEEIQRRHKYRYPRIKDGSSQPRGPLGTVWYVINADWLRQWNQFSKGKEGVTELGKIDNNMLLSEEGILSLKQGLHWKQDFELLEPLAWSALQAWHDGGPPITRSVVPFNPSKTDKHNSVSYSPARPSLMNTLDEYEIELYPLFVTVFLCDTASKGEPRPFQQYVPLSRYLPLEELVDKLCEGLGRDTSKPPHCRLWMMDNTGASLARSATSPCKADDSLGWILDLDLTISDERNNRGVQPSKDENNISLMLEVRNEKDGTWPRTRLKMALEAGKESGENSEESEPALGDGIVGLYNMGNTCYLNSSIQCLSHTPVIRDYFTSKAYLHDINATNPLGYKGHLAQVFAHLVNSLWKKSENSIAPAKKTNPNTASSTPIIAPSLTPKTFRESIGKFNDQFAGNEQHDAQELLAFLLSGLSEDLNRIMEKPYIEAPDSDGRPDEELADIWWTNHLKRELSIIEALFTGQYKSSLTCKTCKYESARFEPFAYLQLPLPEDDQITVQCILYPISEEKDILKYSVRVRHDGTVNDVLISLAKVLHTDESGSAEPNEGDEVTTDQNKRENNSTKETNDDSDSSDEGDSKSDKNSLYTETAQSMAVVDMGESCIRKIIPHSWALSKLSIQDSGEIPPLHVYEIDPVIKSSNTNGNNTNGTTNSSNDSSTGDNVEQSKPVSSVKSSYLAISQRKLDFVPGPFLHPFQLAVFGSPLLLRVRDLEGYTGNDLYALISKRIRRFVPNAPMVHEGGSTSSQNSDFGQDNALSSTNDKGVATTRQLRRGRQHRQKTTADMETVSAGEIPPYGFRLRLVSRDGSRCALCPWFACCVGCVIPCDDFPTIAMCGDSIAIDWHLSVDLQCGGFGWKINFSESAGIQASVHQRALVKVKKHSSFNNGGKMYGYNGSITLEECLDSFAKEEKIPEAYCSKCQEFRIQTKRMSLWRFPPFVIIHLKRFQFTQHMRRKLRDLVVFPIEGLDLSRIVAPSSTNHEHPSNGDKSSKSSEKSTSESDSSDAIGDYNGGNLHPLSKNNCGRSESIYDLYGVVHHQGALSGGHYVASLKSDLDNKWRLFNDAQIYELLSRDVVDPSAYILFYMRRDAKDAKLEDFWDTREREGKGMTEEEVEKMMKQRDRCVIS